MIGKKKKNNHRGYTFDQFGREEQRCCTENKENVDYSGKMLCPEGEMKGQSSILLKIFGLRQAKGTLNLKSEHPDIEMVACLQKKKHSII